MLDIINKHTPDVPLIPFITEYNFICRMDEYNHIRGKSVEDIEESCNFNQMISIEYLIEDKIKMAATIKDSERDYTYPKERLVWRCHVPLKHRDYYKGKLVFNSNTGVVNYNELIRFFKKKNIEKLIKKI